MPPLSVLTNHCKKHARPVEEADIHKIAEMLEEMVLLCWSPRGKYLSASSLCHSQIDDKDPLRFFIFSSGAVIINPKITEKSDPITNAEACFSYPFRPPKKMKRYNKIRVWYKELRIYEGKKQVKQLHEDIEGQKAFDFQHAIGHFIGNCIH